MSETAPEKKSATQMEPRRIGARGSTTRDHRNGAATSQAQMRSFVLSHSQGANDTRKQRRKTASDNMTNARDSGSPRSAHFAKSHKSRGRLIPKFMTQNFHPPSPCIQPGSQRSPDAAEKPPLTSHTAVVAGMTASATNRIKRRRPWRVKTKIAASAKLRKRNAWTLKNGIVAYRKNCTPRGRPDPSRKKSSLHARRSRSPQGSA